MATIIVIDDEGNERMHRNTDEPILTPPPGWDEAKWSGALVEKLVRTLEQERAK